MNSNRTTSIGDKDFLRIYAKEKSLATLSYL